MRSLKEMNIQVTFIDHSGFFVELEECCLLFDYYKGELPPLPAGKPLYVFSSHKHPDHFNQEIFDLAERCPAIAYVLSRDIKFRAQKLPAYEKLESLITYMRKDDVCSVSCGVCEIRVEAFRSTDIGVAFVIYAGDKCIYHAGDLNWWWWTGETEAEQKHMREIFIEQMNLLEGRAFDLAFVPVDGRLEGTWMHGPDYFMRHTNTNLMFPMHFWGNFDMCRQFRDGDWAEPYREHIMLIEKTGEVFA